MSYKMIAKHEKDSRANRDGFVSAMLEMMKEDSSIAYVDCDLMNCINGGKIQSAFPDRAINVGIAEQNGVAVSAGMAAAGMKVFVHSFGCFASRRAFDQAFLSAGYQKVPVHIMGSDPGVSAAFNGATHMPFEDAGLYMSIPNAVVLDVCDYAQLYSLTKKIAQYPFVSYTRFVRKTFNTIYADGSDFEIGKGVTLLDGKDVTLIASGLMLDEALKAAEELEKEGVSACVIDMHTWKPLDEELVIKAAKETGCIVTCENHQVGTGLGAAVAGVLARNYPAPMEMVGIQNRFGQVGPQDFLMKEYGLTAETIIAYAKKAIGRK